METRWPNFFIVGAPKAGTTSLYEYLKDIPGIFLSKRKEPHYFSKKILPKNHLENPVRDNRKYLNLFKNVTTEKVVGEASTSYLLDPEAPSLIHDVSPNAKIVIMLRDPVERTYSAYLMQRRFGRLKNSFHRELEKSLSKDYDPSKYYLNVKSGFYYDSVNRYLKIFGKDQVKIFLFENFIKNPKKVVEETLEFLKVKYDLQNFKGEAHNVFALPRNSFSESILNTKTAHVITQNYLRGSVKQIAKKLFLKSPQSKPRMDEEDRIMLKNLFKDDVKKVQSMFEVKLPWKNFLD